MRNLTPAIISKHNAEEAPETFGGGKDPISAGYLEHGASQGDHRPIWIDIDKETTLGAIFPDLPSHKARRLKCTDLRTVKKISETPRPVL